MVAVRIAAVGSSLGHIEADLDRTAAVADTSCIPVEGLDNPHQIEKSS